MSKRGRYRNLTRHEQRDIAVAGARLRGCTCPKPSVHILKEQRPGHEGHVQVHHNPGCPLIAKGQQTTFDMVVHPEAPGNRCTPPPCPDVEPVTVEGTFTVITPDPEVDQ